MAVFDEATDTDGCGWSAAEVDPCIAFWCEGAGTEAGLRLELCRARCWIWGYGCLEIPPRTVGSMPLAEIPSSLRLKAFLRFNHFVGGEGETFSAVFPPSGEDLCDWPGESESSWSSVSGVSGWESEAW